MKKIQSVILTLTLLLASSTIQASIINGNFQTGDFTNWSTDSATLGSPGFDTDFNIIDTGSGEFVAEIGIDLASTQEFLANTLFTELDLTVANGFGLNLSFDWEFTGEEIGLQSGRDYWFAAFENASGEFLGADGQLGNLIESSAYDFGQFSIDLGTDLFNASDINLTFQLLAGTDLNFLGSRLLIDNVTLSTFSIGNSGPTPATAPSVVALLILSMCSMVLGRRRISR